MTFIKKRRRTHFGNSNDMELRRLVSEKDSLDIVVRNTLYWGGELTAELLRKQCHAVEAGLAARAELKRRVNRQAWQERHTARRFRERE